MSSALSKVIQLIKNQNFEIFCRRPMRDHRAHSPKFASDNRTPHNFSDRRPLLYGTRVIYMIMHQMTHNAQTH
jgi:hypothetical protein